MKKILSLLMILALALSVVACGNTATDTTSDGSLYNIAMVTGYGDITDQSFNQTTWEAIEAFAADYACNFQYFMPSSDDNAARVAAAERAIATGYNGAPMGLAHCEEKGGCLRQQLGVPSGQRHELCRALHAEQNAIIQAASMGHAIEGGTIYITHQPCVICAKMIVNAGIKRIVVKEGYPDELAVEILNEAGLKVEKIGE